MHVFFPNPEPPFLITDRLPADFADFVHDDTALRPYPFACNPNVIEFLRYKI